jgi:hypothetical protein
MKPQNLHAHEDRLLDFVYGELPPLEARAVESHVEGCARCSELLAGIRGVRTTMAQLPMEPAPEAGLESLLAYAQQAARNAAAGPAPKPTWWRRWLMPAMGVAAVTVFAVVTVQVNAKLDVQGEVAAQMAQAPSSPPAQEYATEAQAAGGALGEEKNAPLPAATPPPPAPAAKLDRSWLAKEAPRAKPSTPGRKGSRSDWSNAGTGAALGDTKDAPVGADEELANVDAPRGKKAKAQSYDFESDRRDAMTQAGPFRKPKQILVGSAPAEEEPSQAAMPEPAPADGIVAQSEAEVQQQAPSQGSLRVGGSRSRGAETESANKPAEDSSDDFDDLFGGKTAVAKREQQAPSPAGAPPPPPPTASAAPMPSLSTSAPSAYMPPPATRDESKVEAKRVAASTDLSRQADAARSSGDRVREAQLLRQALAAGATGKERLGLLNRLCDAEFAIGRRQAAFEACSLVLEEDPRSGAAQVARSRLRREGMEDSAAKPGTGSRGPAKAAPADKKRMESIPAQAH